MDAREVGKVLAAAAASGMLAGLAACGAEQRPAPLTPTTDVAPMVDRSCCKGRNACKGKSGCKTETNASCAGKNECKSRGTSCPST